MVELVDTRDLKCDLVAHGQPAAATGLGIDHVDGTGLVVDVPDGESPDLSGAQPAAGHEHEERARLPRPRRRRLQRSRGPQEQGGLAVRQQVRRRTRGSGQRTNMQNMYAPMDISLRLPN